MKYKKTDWCICGHIFDDHYFGQISGKAICNECIILDREFDTHEFKLDNLRYIEDEAKKRKLV
jgi:hypothetical protein